ncbi:thylakoid lumenal 29 kDa protein, chloroplastic isoform X3 [Macadamia integrifolia]|uniref:thylakoid lumenal 29 kDa protein, chloroplastic isoform X3 n=1 Tax=Macadamia integrifolia TaxID=60698 RepID=UPI001C4EE692|nr:thylakoid lumenal 29 kDa protein, chloroplastic isoform X3 [Macadamia integrifolia]
MAVSLAFMSTLPSLLPLYHQPLSTTATRCFTDGICCHKIQATVPHEDGIRRRDVLRFVGATVGMELVACSGSCVEMANAADLIQLKQRSEFLSSIKKTLNSFLKGNMELIPSILTLALNDAMTYDKATKSGGPNGSIRFSSEIIRPENKGLSAALKLLEEAKHEIDSYSKGGPISFADLIQYAAQSAIKSTFLASAIRKCGGNEEKGALLYTAYGSNGQDLHSRKTTGGGCEKDGLYYLNSGCPPTYAAATDVGDVSLFQWHCRLGHLVLPRLQLLFPSFLYVYRLEYEACELG